MPLTCVVKNGLNQKSYIMYTLPNKKTLKKKGRKTVDNNNLILLLLSNMSHIY